MVQSWISNGLHRCILAVPVHDDPSMRSLTIITPCSTLWWITSITVMQLAITHIFTITQLLLSGLTITHHQVVIIQLLLCFLVLLCVHFILCHFMRYVSTVSLTSLWSIAELTMTWLVCSHMNLLNSYLQSNHPKTSVTTNNQFWPHTIATLEGPLAQFWKKRLNGRYIWLL